MYILAVYPNYANEVIMLENNKKLSTLFRNNRAMRIQDLQRQLNNRSRRSIFRDIANNCYYSSYTHAGKYYTLRRIPDFNSDGLWVYKNIGISKHGTLKDTIIFLTDCSKAGRTHDDLKKVLHIRVHNTLLELVKTDKLARKQFNNIYVYVSAKKETSEQHLAKRHLLSTAENNASELPSELIQIKIFVEIIRSNMETINPILVTAQLRGRGERISAEAVRSVLVFYGLKKN